LPASIFTAGTVIPIARMGAGAAVTTAGAGLTLLTPISGYYSVANTNGIIYANYLTTTTCRLQGNVGP
jgi:hypothetical protein